MKNLGVQGVYGVHGFQRKISNGAFHPVAVAKDRTDTEKFTIALSARWPWQETVPKRKNFHRCTFSPVAVEEDRTKTEKFPAVPFSLVALVKNQGVQGVHGVHGFQRKTSNGAFHPVAVAKDRTET